MEQDNQARRRTPPYQSALNYKGGTSPDSKLMSGQHQFLNHEKEIEKNIVHITHFQTLKMDNFKIVKSKHKPDHIEKILPYM